MQHDLNTSVQIMHERPEPEIQGDREKSFHCLKRQQLYEDKQLLTRKLQTYIYLLKHMPEQRSQEATNPLTNYPRNYHRLFLLQTPRFLFLKASHMHYLFPFKVIPLHCRV